MSSHLFSNLPTHIATHIFSFLATNEIACTVRFINKAIADQFSNPEHKTVRLSQPVPHPAFVAQWGPDSAALRLLSLSQRRQLLNLTASSGSLDNLLVAVRSVGLVPREHVMEAAAAAGHVHICSWLQQQGCPWGRALSTAAEARRQDVCHWLLANGAVLDTAALRSAARSGDAALLDSLLQRSSGRPGRRIVGPVLQGVIDGFDLLTLQEKYSSWLARPEEGGRSGGQRRLRRAHRRCLLRAAAGSRTSDWRAKMEWLELELRCPRSYADCTRAAAGMPDAVDRLQWLRQRGYPLTQDAVFEAAKLGNLAALRYLVEEAEVQMDGEAVAAAAAFMGQVEVLQYLCEHGSPMEHAVVTAAQQGHMKVVTWLVETCGLPPDDDWGWGWSLLDAAAGSGRLELVVWLHERGWQLKYSTLARAAGGGCEALLEWLVERRCQMPAFGELYDKAAINGDIAMLCCLRRLGCPWSNSLFHLCMFYRRPVASLRFTMEECFPVEWEPAEERAHYRQDGGEAAAWLQQEKLRRLEEVVVHLAAAEGQQWLSVTIIAYVQQPTLPLARLQLSRA